MKQLYSTLSQEVVPLLAEGLLHNEIVDLQDLERSARLLAIRLLCARCAKGRGLTFSARACDKGRSISEAVLYQAAMPLDELNLKWETLPARVVGECYEALLGQRLTLAHGRYVLVGDRGRRKATGSFYTPEPIVKRIVAATIEPLLAERPCDAHDLSDICILDPAMGSGYFLVAAIDKIAAWLTQQGSAPKVEQRILRQRIAEQCIYGVDRDPDAVEVARLCVWLHCATIDWHSEAIEAHLRCGNSLVGRGFHGPRATPYADEVEAFDWAAAFPAIATKGGFAAVVGNPPYVTRFLAVERRHIMSWTTTRGRELDAFYLFVERSTHLLQQGGRCGMIIPNVFLRQHDSATFRRFLLAHTVEQIVDYDFGAFGAATVPAAIVIFRTSPAAASQHIQFQHSDGTMQSIPQITFALLPDAQFNPQLAAIQPILEALATRCAPLAAFATSHEGIHSGNIRHKLFTRMPDGTTTHPLLKGSDIERYAIHWGGWYVRYDPTLIDRQSGDYASLRDKQLFTTPKIWTRQTGDRIIATWDDTISYADNTLHATQPRRDCPLSPLYLLALLNSRLLTAIYRALTGEQGRALAQVKLVFLRRLPIRRIAFTTPLEERQQMVRQGVAVVETAHEREAMALVDRWLNDGFEDVIHDLLAWLAQQMMAATQHNVARAAAIDHLIDQIVERLYGVAIETIGRGQPSHHEGYR